MAPSQRFKVAFASEPSEQVRYRLKSIILAAWELYTWQARPYDREQLAIFLSALEEGGGLRSRQGR